METFEIDVSGQDIFSKDYTIVVADKNNLVKGFKFDKDIIEKITSNFKLEKYRYKTSRSQQLFLKVRIYCIIIHYLFKEITRERKLSGKKVRLEICRDFPGHEREITSQLKYFFRG